MLVILLAIIVAILQFFGYHFVTIFASVSIVLPFGRV
jgi:hypothetical protein